ncbi:MAG: UDP-N-acetylmuramoyl-L-alanyl-D-glutamate--2,6-diaminopimelate ligase [Chloroflexota bacterium]
MKLSTLLQGMGAIQASRHDDLDINGISYDSRRVSPGFLFVAIPGFHVDGHSFIADAVARGAVAVVVQEDRKDAIGSAVAAAPTPPAVIGVPDTRRALAELAAAFYGYPARKLRVIGVTGTDGKTTTCYLISNVLEKAGYRTGLIGTVDFKVGDEVWYNDARQTTPESLEVQELLSRMVDAKVDYAIVESTSHGLALERLTGCEYDVAVFTNLSSDHLDFHQTLEQYLRDKGRLFEMLSEACNKGIDKVSILNADDAASDYLRRLSPLKVIDYSVERTASVMARDIRLSGSGTSFTAVTPMGNTRLEMKLGGIFSVYNSLAAIAVAVSQKVSLAVTKEALESMGGVPGRMEQIDLGQPFTVIVDYAHTPAALEKMLGILRPLAKGKMLVVFGCAGERDKARRPGMGKVAGRLADFSVVTNEDPRSEDPVAIIDEIEVGLKSAGRQANTDYARVVDRRDAIRYAFEKASPGDLVLLAGKGHEKCIIAGNERVPWDDREVARETLRELGF